MSKSLNSAQIAQSWLDLGIQPVPLKYGSKIPKGGKGWNTLQVTDETIEEFFKRGDNIGGLWGEPSDWIVDIDLDWDEACELAEYLLPETFVYGRRSRPGSHYLYRCPGIMGSKRHLKKGEMIVEIRSTGSQSVLPPSISPENFERYEINQDTGFKQLARSELERLVDEVAAGAVLIRNFPESGSRHDYVHTITGSLLWTGWKEKRVRKFVGAILKVTNPLDDDADQRERTLRNTIEHFKKGNRIAGWNTLSQWIDGADLMAIKKWLGTASRFEETPKEIVTELGPKDKADAVPRFDPKFLNIPGLAGELIDWCQSQSFMQQPVFDLAGALMCTALTSANKYLIQGWLTPIQPYFMLMAPTSAGKGAAISNVYKYAKRLDLHHHVYQGFQSYYALLDQLVQPPNMACWLWDEVARHLASAKSPSSPDYSTISHLISLYGRANDEVPAFPGRKNAIPALDRPFLTLMGTAQPRSFIESLSVSQIATGFINRLILFDAGDNMPEPHLERQDIFPSALKKQALLLKQHEPRNGLTTSITYDAKVYAHYRDFDSHTRQLSMRGGEEEEIWGRANQNALILAGIVAVGFSPNRPKITLEMAQWSTGVIEWSIRNWLCRIGTIVSRNLREGESKKIEEYIRNARRYIHRAPSKKMKEAMEKGVMPRSALLRICRNLDSRQLEDILDQLIDARLIGMSEDDKGRLSYWPKN